MRLPWDAPYDFLSKTDGVDTYTFTYTRELKIAAISLNAQVLHRFGYDANGNRVAEQRADGTLVFSVGGYYEYSQKGAETHTTVYYGSEALRVDGVLRFILTDHLGSTAVVTESDGGNPIWEGYDAWGKTRFVTGVIPTDKQYTGQRISEDIGLYDYKARWYDPLLGRFLNIDTIIPVQGIQRMDGYAYANNRPISFIDPSGQVCQIANDEGICVLGPDAGQPVSPYYDPVKLDDWGEKMESLFYELVRTPDWWNEDGTFTLEEFFEMMLGYEFMTLYLSDAAINDFEKLATTLAIVGTHWAFWFSSEFGDMPKNWNTLTPNLIFNFIGCSGSMRLRYDAVRTQGKTIEQQFQEEGYQNLAQSVRAKIYKAPLDWKTGGYAANGQPMTWGNATDTHWPEDRINEFMDLPDEGWNLTSNVSGQTVTYKFGNFAILTKDEVTYWRTPPKP